MAATFIQILKTFVRIGDIVLDKSAPTPSFSTGTCFIEPSGEDKA